MSKKLRVIVAVICFAVILGSVLTAVIYKSSRDGLQSVFDSSRTSDEIDDIFSKKYSRGEKLSKAKKAVNAVWLSGEELSNEGNDSSQNSYALSDVCESVFDAVFIKSYLAFTDEQLTALSEAEKTVVVSVKADDENDFINGICQASGVSGIIVQGLDTAKEADSAKRLSEIYSLAKTANPAITVYADLPYKWKNFELVSNGCMDVLYSEIDCDVDRMSATVVDYSAYSYDDCVRDNVFDAWACYWNLRAAEASLALYIGYRADLVCTGSFNGCADTPLIQTILSDSLSALKGRVYNDYQSVVTDRDNSMSSVLTFITKGLSIDLACRRLSITDYSGEVIDTESPTAEFVIKCSSVFPLYIDGKSYDLQKSGVRKITADLSTGANEFEIMQNGTTLVYKVNYTAGAVSPLLTFIIPDTEVCISGGEMLDITVGGHNMATVTVTVGGETVTMQKSNDSYAGYTTFTASVKMPEGKTKKQDLGQISLVAKADGVADETYRGARVIINAEKKVTETTTKKVEETGTTLPSDNEVLTTTQIYSNEQSGSSGGNSSQSVTSTTRKPLDASVISKVCIVTSEYAETRPVTPLSNTYIPTFTALPKGTLDTIADVTEYDDGDDLIQYYILASGRRIMMQDANVLESCTLTDNSVTLKSCTTSPGSSELLLSTKWRVPYNVTLTPQSYSGGYEGKLYNVSSFTADKMEISFWYTPEASGSADLSSSDVVSSCSWSSDASSNKSTLTINFKKSGCFYGYSIGYNDDGELYIRITNRVGKLSGSVIMLDAGHGGSDVGALGRSGQIYESSLNLQIATLLADYLTEQGAKVYMTRTDNSSVTLAQRRAQTELIKPDLFVSIHCNSSEKPSTCGPSVYYYTPWSRALAGSIESRLSSLFGTTFYTAGQSSNVGTNFYAFSVCRPTVCPSVLVETAFLSNSADCDILTNADNREMIAEAIGNGIGDYLKMQAY